MYNKNISYIVFIFCIIYINFFKTAINYSSSYIICTNNSSISVLTTNPNNNTNIVHTPANNKTNNKKRNSLH